MNEPRRTSVIFNPNAARGLAKERLRRLQAQLANRAEFLATTGPGHAETLAFDAANQGVERIVAAGGDGTVHEVANGILRAKRPDCVFALHPIGSANDFAFSLERMTPTPAVRPVDVGLVRSEHGQRYFVNSLGLGFSGAVALESRAIHGCRGLILYGLAFLKALWKHYGTPTMEIRLDEESLEERTLSLTIALGQREGNFTVAPQAVLDDGWFDILHAGALSRWEVLRVMPNLAAGKELAPHPHIRHGRCRQVRLSSSAPLLVHLDGEFFCTARDEVRALEVELLPGALLVEYPRQPSADEVH